MKYTIAIGVFCCFWGCKHFQEKGNLVKTQRNSITNIQVKRPEGVGLTSFIFELSIKDQDLRNLLDDKDKKVNFVFFPPLQLLNKISTPKIYLVDSCKYHLLLSSTLWADVNENTFTEEVEMINDRTKIVLINSESNMKWELEAIGLNKEKGIHLRE
jgi:hypothetical protein